jgi:hypothetical protein
MTKKPISGLKIVCVNPATVDHPERVFACRLDGAATGSDFPYLARSDEDLLNDFGFDRAGGIMFWPGKDKIAHTN